MSIKKMLFGVISSAVLIGTISPSFSYANETDVTEEEAVEGVTAITVSDAEMSGAEALFKAVEELDGTLDMEDVSNNDKEDIDSLSEDGQQLYELYLEKLESDMSDEEKTLALLSQFKTEQQVNTKSNLIKASSIGSIKKYYLSNADVNSLIKNAGLNGGFWATVSAVAKRFGKNPTYVTALIVAVPALGVAVINKCNKYNKGVVIQDIRIGATHNFSCSARK